MERTIAHVVVIGLLANTCINRTSRFAMELVRFGSRFARTGPTCTPSVAERIDGPVTAGPSTTTCERPMR
ncbi:hypothetical protein ACWHA1_39770 [Streptomyces decoyicus]